MEKLAQTKSMNVSFYIEYLKNQSKYYLDSEEAFISFVRAICKQADQELPKLFSKLPRCPYGVLPIPANEAPNAPAAYYMPPPSDCSRSGLYYVNTFNLTSRPTYLYQSTSLHEAVPGHHLQIAIQQELSLPDFRKFSDFSAFVEGWALYAESLGNEMGFYQNPDFKFGSLGDEILRACRLVIDTGIHSLKWTRQQSIEFMQKHTPMSQLDIESEVDRYIVWPGQALSYKMGELKIKELRQKAQLNLKSQFDIRAFHDAILRQGSLPLDFVDRQVDDYIQNPKES